MRGSVVLETQLGDLEVGIREGTAAWLDVSATRRQGAQRARRPPTRPSASAETVEVRARTSVGNVVDPAARDDAAHRRIAATGLRKSYGDHVVLDGIDLDVAEGTIFALLGPNGAGKTTIVQILSTLIGADGGELRVAGHDLAARARRGPRGDRRHRPVLGRRQPAHRARRT